MTIVHDELSIEWLGYATVRLEHEDVVAYLDPGRYGVLTGEWEPDTPGIAHPPSRDYRPEDGDIVCVTHVHHYDDDAIDRVADDDATVVVFEGVNRRDTDRDVRRPVELDYDLRRVSQEEDLSVDGVPMWTVPAYNDPDGDHVRPSGDPYHPEGFGCGFLLALGDLTVFWPGDTDVLEGHAELDVDVLLPPIGGSFTMDREQAAGLAADLRPELVVPIHYNTFEALETDSGAFATDVARAGVPVALDESG
ncbi:MBL fold metallo-hydrolase [Halapricum sp. CBA1109]|uniref:MBL fold metallo-hydrolase n=1 Tax=Halapricum sp. CBA1109 TaxID=2668068 RepID=UPI0012F93ED4|nr:MBL fold metallo-hydrolase [Halapricum sp. CBA1109]MUV88762.1 MBL fold metallo-hydrolase [Halapricum sp. CBA1109]